MNQFGYRSLLGGVNEDAQAGSSMDVSAGALPGFRAAIWAVFRWVIHSFLKNRAKNSKNTNILGYK